MMKNMILKKKNVKIQIMFIVYERGDFRYFYKNTIPHFFVTEIYNFSHFFAKFHIFSQCFAFFHIFIQLFTFLLTNQLKCGNKPFIFYFQHISATYL